MKSEMNFRSGIQHNDESFKHPFIFRANTPFPLNLLLAETVKKDTTNSSKNTAIYCSYI